MRLKKKEQVRPDAQLLINQLEVFGFKSSGPGEYSKTNPDGTQFRWVFTDESVSRYYRLPEFENWHVFATARYEDLKVHHETLRGVKKSKLVGWTIHEPKEFIDEPRNC